MFSFFLLSLGSIGFSVHRCMQNAELFPFLSAVEQGPFRKGSDR